MFPREVRRISSIRRRISRLLGGLVRGGRRGPRAPTTLIAWAAVLFVAFIVGGGIYDLLDNPVTVLPGPYGGWITVHPYSGEQTLNESLVSMVLTLFMFSGLLVAYKSTQVVYDSRRANMMLIVGIAFILLGLAGSHYLMILKRTVAS